MRRSLTSSAIHFGATHAAWLKDRSLDLGAVLRDVSDGARSLTDPRCAVITARPVRSHYRRVADGSKMIDDARERSFHPFSRRAGDWDGVGDASRRPNLNSVSARAAKFHAASDRRGRKYLGI